MTYIVPKQLKEDFKIHDRPCIWWKDVVTVAILLGTFLFCKIFVHSWLQISYWITAAVSSIFLIQPAAGNPKKRNWEAIFLFIGKDRMTHYSVNHVSKLR